MMKNLIVAAMVALTVGVAMAADVQLIDDNCPEGGDIVNTDFWPNGTFPELVQGAEESSDNPWIQPLMNATRTFTLSRNIRVRDFILGKTQQNPATTIFDLGKDRTISVWGDAEAGFWFGGTHSMHQNFILKSGTIERIAGGKSGTFRLNASGCNTCIVESVNAKLDMGQITVGNYNTFFCVTNGALVRGKFWMNGSYPTGMVVRVVGKDKATGTPSTFDNDSQTAYAFDTANTYFAGDYDWFPRFEVLDGAVATNFNGRLPNRGHSLRVLVDNAVFHCNGGLNIGGDSAPSNNCFHVRNGGLLTYPTTGDNFLFVGGGNGANNRLIVENATLNWRRVTVGSSTSTGCELVLSNATVTTTHADGDCTIWVGGKGDASQNQRSGTNNTVRVIDCTWDADHPSAAFFYCDAGLSPCSNALYVSGTRWHNPRNLNLPGFSATSHGSLMQFDGGSFVTSDAERSPYLAGTEGTFRIAGGASVEYGTNTSTLVIGNLSNRLEVLDGATFGIGNLSFSLNSVAAENGRIVLSNGTLKVYKNLDFSAAGNGNRIVFQGATPKLDWPAKVDGNAVKSYTSPTTGLGTWRFELPAEPYAAAPLSSDANTTVSDDSTFEFDFRNVSKAGGKYPLVSSAQSLTITDAQLAKIDAAAKTQNPRAKAMVVDKTLYVRLPGDNGLMILLR